LVGDWAYIGQSRQEFQGPTFEIAFPITGADELLGLLGEGEDT
jgi:hypothetical protein